VPKQNRQDSGEANRLSTGIRRAVIIPLVEAEQVHQGVSTEQPAREQANVVRMGASRLRGTFPCAARLDFSGLVLGQDDRFLVGDIRRARAEAGGVVAGAGATVWLISSTISALAKALAGLPRRMPLDRAVLACGRHRRAMYVNAALRPIVDRVRRSSGPVSRKRFREEGLVETVFTASVLRRSGLQIGGEYARRSLRTAGPRFQSARCRPTPVATTRSPERPDLAVGRLREVTCRTENSRRSDRHPTR